MRSFRHMGKPPTFSRPTKPTSPLVALSRPRVAGFHPRWGTTRPSPVRGRFGPHRAQFSRKKRKRPGPESSRQRRRRMRQLLTSHQAHGFLKTSSGERCEKQAGERPGVAGASPAGSPRPAEPVVPGFFPGVNFPIFRGRFGGLGVTDGVRKQEFPGSKPFLRVSPPGSTKG